MTEKYQVDEKSEYREYPVMTISRNDIRSKFGDKVAEQISDDMVSEFASALGCLTENDDDIWKAWFEEEGVEFDGDYTYFGRN